MLSHRILSHLSRRALRLARRFVADRRGGVLVETAILMPILTMIVLSGTEIGRYTLLQQKLNRAAVSMSDLIAQTDASINMTQVANLYQAAGYVMRPFDLTTEGIIIITSVARTGGNTTVRWQCLGGGGLSASSNIGTTGNNANLPSGFVLRDGESAVFAEVVYHYEPFVVPHLINIGDVRHTAMFRPRFGALTSLAAGTTPPGAPTCT